MDLKKYLDNKRLTYAEFANQLGIHTHSLHNVVYGKKKPSLDLAVKIEELTDGEITAKDLLYFFNNQPQEKPKRKYRGKIFSKD